MSVTGCDACCPASAADAWARIRDHEMGARLVEESHLGISLHPTKLRFAGHPGLRRCRACGQRFVMVFSEQIDWQGGNDPQGGALVPVDEAEATRLEGLAERVHPGALGALTDGRRWLAMDHPREGPQTFDWMTGPFVILRND